MKDVAIRKLKAALMALRQTRAGKDMAAGVLDGTLAGVNAAAQGMAPLAHWEDEPNHRFAARCNEPGTIELGMNLARVKRALKNYRVPEFWTAPGFIPLVVAGGLITTAKSVRRSGPPQEWNPKDKQELSARPGAIYELAMSLSGAKQALKGMRAKIDPDLKVLRKTGTKMEAGYEPFKHEIKIDRLPMKKGAKPGVLRSLKARDREYGKLSTRMKSLVDSKLNTALHETGHAVERNKLRKWYDQYYSTQQRHRPLDQSMINKKRAMLLHERRANRRVLEHLPQGADREEYRKWANNQMHAGYRGDMARSMAQAKVRKKMVEEWPKANPKKKPERMWKELDPKFAKDTNPSISEYKATLKEHPWLRSKNVNFELPMKPSMIHELGVFHDLPDDWERQGEAHFRNNPEKKWTGAMDITQKTYAKPKKIKAPEGWNPLGSKVTFKHHKDKEGMTMYDEVSPSRRKRAQIIAGVGAGIAGLAGAGYAIKKWRNLSMKSSMIVELAQMNAAEKTAYQPSASDKRSPRYHRYTHDLKDEDINRGWGNATKATIGGAILGAAMKGKKLKVGHRAAIGALGGAATVGAVRAITKKDQFGERTYSGKIAESVPGIGAGVLAGGLLAHRVAKKIGFAARPSMIIELAPGDFLMRGMKKGLLTMPAAAQAAAKKNLGGFKRTLPASPMIGATPSVGGMQHTRNHMAGQLRAQRGQLRQMYDPHKAEAWSTRKASEGILPSAKPAVKPTTPTAGIIPKKEGAWSGRLLSPRALPAPARGVSPGAMQHVAQRPTLAQGAERFNQMRAAQPSLQEVADKFNTSSVSRIKPDLKRDVEIRPTSSVEKGGMGGGRSTATSGLIRGGVGATGGVGVSAGPAPIVGRDQTNRRWAYSIPEGQIMELTRDPTEGGHWERHSGKYTGAAVGALGATAGGLAALAHQKRTLKGPHWSAKRVGLTTGVLGAAAGLYAGARKDRNRKELSSEPNQIMEFARIRGGVRINAKTKKALIHGTALAGGITAADVATEGIMAEEGKKKKAMKKGMIKGAIYGTALAATEPAFASGLKRAILQRAAKR